MLDPRMADPHLLTAIIALVYAVLTTIDGVWLHLWRYQLHRHAPAEHALHTARAILFSGVVLLLLMGWAHGPLLWFGALLALADLALVAWDAALETRSRAFQHGLPAGEAALHTLLQALHAVVLVCAVAVRPWEVWSGAPLNEPAPGATAHLLLLLVLSGSVSIALIHLALMHPRRTLSPLLRWPWST